MNVTEENFEIRSCIKILANDIKVDTTVHALQLTETGIHMGDLHPLALTHIVQWTAITHSIVTNTKVVIHSESHKLSTSAKHSVA